nr:protein FAM83A-like [Equus asinus]
MTSLQRVQYGEREKKNNFMVEKSDEHYLSRAAALPSPPLPSAPLPSRRSRVCGCVGACVSLAPSRTRSGTSAGGEPAAPGWLARSGRCAPASPPPPPPLQSQPGMDPPGRDHAAAAAAAARRASGPA